VDKCSVCGYKRHDLDIKCPECGHFYSKIIELIAEQEAQEEMQTLRGHCKKILNSKNAKQALLAELKLAQAGLTNKGKFALFVIFVFVFALVVSVL
jgi:predicted ATP-dependent serine protease